MSTTLPLPPAMPYFACRLSATSVDSRSPARERWISLAFVILTHTLAFALLARISLPVKPPRPTEPMVMELVTAPAPQIAQAKIPKASPVRPSLQKRPTPAAQPIVHTTAPSETVAAATPLTKAAPIITPTRPDTPIAPAPAPTPSAETEQAPRFDAAYLNNPAPTYPAASRRLGEAGRVLLSVQIDTDGQPLQVLIDSGSGFPRLDRAAREAVARWRFVPARHGQQAVVGWVKVPVIFEMKS